MKKENSKILLSIEQLHHFNCGACKKWWSIGDAEKQKKEWFCPWCGILQKVSAKPEMNKIKRKF